MRKQEIEYWNKNEQLVKIFNLLYDDAFADFRKEVKLQKDDGSVYVQPDFEIIEKKIISYEFLRQEIENNRKINDEFICTVGDAPGKKVVYYVSSDDFSYYVTMLHDYVARNLLLVTLVKGGLICDQFNTDINDFNNLSDYWFAVMMEIKANPGEHRLLDVIIFENLIHDYEKRYYEKIDGGLLFYSSTMGMLGDIRSNLCRLFPAYSDLIYNLTAKSSRLIKYAIENSIQCETL